MYICTVKCGFECSSHSVGLDLYGGGITPSYIIISDVYEFCITPTYIIISDIYEFCIQIPVLRFLLAAVSFPYYRVLAVTVKAADSFL